eukprot:11156923-Lingulodinium_polyedra.AAC.1
MNEQSRLSIRQMPIASGGVPGVTEHPPWGKTIVLLPPRAETTTAQVTDRPPVALCDVGMLSQ